jgi:hypothetical protein
MWKVLNIAFQQSWIYSKRLGKSPAKDLLVKRIHYTRLNAINKPESILARNWFCMIEISTTYKDTNLCGKIKSPPSTCLHHTVHNRVFSPPPFPSINAPCWPRFKWFSIQKSRSKPPAPARAALLSSDLGLHAALFPRTKSSRRRSASSRWTWRIGCESISSIGGGTAFCRLIRFSFCLGSIVQDASDRRPTRTPGDEQT